MLSMRSVAIGILIILGYAGCSDENKLEGAPEVTRKIGAVETKPPTLNQIVDEVTRREMADYDAECTGLGLAGARDCWIKKLNATSYQKTNDAMAFSTMARNMDPAFVKEVKHELTGSDTQIGFCYKQAMMNPRSAVECHVRYIAYLNASVMAYERREWVPSEPLMANEDFVGD